MNKLTMLDYVKETPDVLKTNIEQYTTLVDPLMRSATKRNKTYFTCCFWIKS